MEVKLKCELQIQVSLAFHVDGAIKILSVYNVYLNFLFQCSSPYFRSTEQNI